MKRKAGVGLKRNVGVAQTKFLVAEATIEVYMTHPYRLHYFHLIWSTKQRLPHIDQKRNLHLNHAEKEY